jgi:hypothetical protein
MSKKRTKQSKIKRSIKREQAVASEPMPEQVGLAKKTLVKEPQAPAAWRMFFRYDPVWIARDLRKTIFVSSLILLVLLLIALLYT